MAWVLIFGGIAVVGLITVVSYGIWLAHKASDVMSEVAVLSDRTGQLLDLVGQIEAPPRERESVSSSIVSAASSSDLNPPADPPPAT